MIGSPSSNPTSLREHFDPRERTCQFEAADPGVATEGVCLLEDFAREAFFVEALAMGDLKNVKGDQGG